MSEKALRWIINIAGIICLYAFLAIRVLPMFNAVLLEKYIPEYWENTKWGELYYFSFIRHFREKNLPDYKIKYRFTPRHPKVQDADILTFGDSFFDFSRMTTFPEQLADSLHQKVFYARMDQPLRYLADHNYQNSEKKYLIFETAERFLHDRFFEPQPRTAYIDNRSGIRKTVADIRDFLFLDDTELLFSMLLSRSYFTTGVHSIINTLKFDLFRQITPQTPVYSLNFKDRPWLFGALQLDDGPRGYECQHTPEEISNYCNNIELLANELQQKYNLEMIFMIIPSKYTVYHHIVGTEDSLYGNFIPEMYDELNRRGIPVITFYKEFMAQRYNKLLYYGTDTHWTEDGLQIALNKSLQLLNSLQVGKVNSYHTKTQFLSQK
jgi:hypothetical protein